MGYGKNKTVEHYDDTIPSMFYVDFSLALQRNKKWTIGV